MKTRILAIVVAAVVLVTSSYFVARRHGSHVLRKSTAHRAPSVAQGRQVRIAGLKLSPVVMSPVTSVLTVTGEVQFDDDTMAKVGSSAAGRLAQLNAVVGMPVRQGQTLAVIAERNNIEPIIAPIDGVITERLVTPGQAVNPSSDLFTIVNTDRMWVWANVYEKDLASVRVGQSAQIQVVSFPGKVYAGTITYIAPAMKADTHTARVRCEVANPGELKAGMFAMVDIATDFKAMALLIPREAVLDNAGKKIVFTPSANSAGNNPPGGSVSGFNAVEVTLGPVHGAQVEVTNGLRAGMDIVTVGQYQLLAAFRAGQIGGYH